MLKFLFGFLLFLTFGTLQGQSLYPITYRDVTFNDTYYTNNPVKMRVFYPTLSAGDAQPAAGKFPVLAFGHGFLMNYLAYINIFEHLASSGYIVAVPDEQNGFNVDHAIFARQLCAAVRYLREGNDPLKNATDSTCAVVGHSMGGGAAMLAPRFFPGLTAVAGLAPAQTNSEPTAIDGLKSVRCPVLIISSKGDSVTPERAHAVPMYRNAAGKKLHISLTDGGHCRFSDGANFACDFGATTAGDKARLTHAAQQGFAKKYLTGFFDFVLKNKKEAETFICGDTIKSDVRSGQIRTETNFACQTGIFSEPERYKLPFTFKDNKRISFGERLFIGSITDLNGKTLLRWELQNEIFIPELPSGVYIINVPGYLTQKIVKF